MKTEAFANSFDRDKAHEMYEQRKFLIQPFSSLNRFALRMAETQWNFGHSECKRVKLLIDNVR